MPGPGRVGRAVAGRARRSARRRRRDHRVRAHPARRGPRARCPCTGCCSSRRHQHRRDDAAWTSCSTPGVREFLFVLAPLPHRRRHRLPGPPARPRCRPHERLGPPTHSVQQLADFAVGCRDDGAARPRSARTSSAASSTCSATAWPARRGRGRDASRTARCCASSPAGAARRRRASSAPADGCRRRPPRWSTARSRTRWTSTTPTCRRSCTRARPWCPAALAAAEEARRLRRRAARRRRRRHRDHQPPRHGLATTRELRNSCSSRRACTPPRSAARSAPPRPPALLLRPGRRRHRRTRWASPRRMGAGRARGQPHRRHGQAGALRLGGARAASPPRDLAPRGLTGPPTVLEGRFGFFHAYAATAGTTPSALPAGSASAGSCRGRFYKPYPTNHFTHTGIDVRAGPARAGPRPGRRRARRAGRAPRRRCAPSPSRARRRSARDRGYHAQFSGPFTFAIALLGGGGLGVYLDDFTDGASRPAPAGLAARVTCVGRRARQRRLFPTFAAVLRVRIRRGQLLNHRVDSSRGGRQPAVAQRTGAQVPAQRQPRGANRAGRGPGRVRRPTADRRQRGRPARPHPGRRRRPAPPHPPGASPWSTTLLARASVNAGPPPHDGRARRDRPTVVELVETTPHDGRARPDHISDLGLDCARTPGSRPIQSGAIAGRDPRRALPRRRTPTLVERSQTCRDPGYRCS